MSTFVLVACVAVLVVAQGGYFGLATCACGVVACLTAGVTWARKARRGAAVVKVPLLFLGLAMAYLMSALASVLSLTTLSEAGCWAAVAGVSFLAAAQSPEQRAQTLRALGWLGVATAVGGVLVHAGLLTIRGGMVVERLQFTFQYANAAGVWFGMVALLCLLGPDGRLRSLAALPAAAMLLTQSGGTLLAFLLVAGVTGVAWARKGSWERLAGALVQGMLAVVLFGALLMADGWLSVVALAVAVLVCVRFGSEKAQAWLRPRAKVLSLGLCGLLLVAAVMGAIALSSRASQALGTFGERWWQVRDGLALWMRSPLLGVGPDRWQYLYLDMQTAPYHVAVVHCSYVQVLLDAGVVGMALLVAACVVGLRRDEASGNDEGPHSGWEGAARTAAALLLLHALIDFDLQFGSLAAVLALLLTRVDEAPSAGKAPVRGAHAAVACLALCVPLCVLGLLCDTSEVALSLANARGDYATCRSLFEANPLARADSSAQGEYLAACYALDDHEAVVATYARMASTTDVDTDYAVMSLEALGEHAQAGEVLVSRLERQPYNAEFLDDAQALVVAYGLDPSLQARYEAAVARVQENAGL